MLLSLILAGVSVIYGPGQMLCLAPNGDSTLTNWVATGAATGYDSTNDPVLSNCVWNGTHDSDSTYIRGPASTACTAYFDLVNTSGLSGKTILYVSGSGMACKRNAGTGAPTAEMALRVSGTDYSLGSASCNSTSAYLEDNTWTKYYTNPATGVAWTSADIDSLQLTVTRTGSSPREIYVTGVHVVVAYEEADTVGAYRQRSGGGN